MGADKALTFALRRLDEPLSRDTELIDRLVEVFREARRERLQFTIDLHDAEEDRAFLRDPVLPHDEVWIAETAGRVAGFIAFAGGWVHHLYVSPIFQRCGIGGELLAIAKRATASLQLWAFEATTPAIEFYLGRGFRIVERTDGSGNEARQPDVRMQWKG